MNLQHLRQAVIVAAKQDVRFYLAGVHLNGYETVATDGHRAVHCDASGTDSTPYDGYITIPRDVVLALLKVVPKDVTEYIIERPATPYALCTLVAGTSRIQFEPIEGTYPDYKRAFLNHKYGKGSVESIGFNPKYLADIAKVFPKCIGVKFEFLDASQVVKITASSHVGVSYYLMPCRV